MGSQRQEGPLSPTMREFAKESPETDSSSSSPCTLCSSASPSPGRWRRRDKINQSIVQLPSVQKESTQCLAPLPSSATFFHLEMTETENSKKDGQEEEDHRDYHPKRLSSSPSFLFLSKMMPSPSILFLLTSSFLISISTSEVSQLSSSSTLSSNNNDDHSSPIHNFITNGSNATGRNIYSGSFATNSFGGGSSFPINSNPSTESSTYSKPTAYFIAGLATQIRRVNSTAMMLLTRDKPFQLQFRTVCPFGNIVNDEKIMISINSGGNLTYTIKPNEFPSSISHHTVSDGRWHSITFHGPQIYLDNHDLDLQMENPQIPLSVHWDTNSSAENDQPLKLNQILHFFDGFVGCIRILAPTHDHATGGRKQQQQQQQNIQSHEESYLTPESPLEQQVVSLFDLFQLRTPFAPCNDTDVELASVHSCFNPDTFVLCNKCKNGHCRSDPSTSTDNPMNNRCDCHSHHEVQYSGKYCESPPSSSSTPNSEEAGHRQNSDEVEHSSRDSGEVETGSSSSNLETSLVDPDNSSGRVALTASNVVEPVSSSTMEPPQEFPFLLEEGSQCPCVNGGGCIPSLNHPGQHICNCTTAWEGEFCQIDVDECTRYEKICNHGICQNELGNFKCYCRTGWTGLVCNRSLCFFKPCQNGGSCHPEFDSYRCQCVEGFQGTDCETETDECESNPCQNGGICEDKLNDFNCTCQRGFTGKFCQIDIDDCASSPCENGGKCIDKVDSFLCDCTDTGFEGDFCQENVDDCAPGVCFNNGTCVDGVKGFSCVCFDGYDGADCSVDKDECANKFCENGAECFQKSNESLYASDIDPRIRELLPSEFSYETAAGYVCLCNPGYTDTNCSINIDECALEVMPCGRNGICRDGVNSYSCECQIGYQGEKCETETNECEPNPCVRGECFDKIGDYECKCPDGFGAKNCGILLTGCLRDPCDPIGFSKCKPFYDEQSTNHTFECECKEGFTGKTCHLNTVMSFNGSGPVEITTNGKHYDIGHYELHFKFRTTLPDVLLIVGSGITYFYLTLSGGKLNLQSSLLNSLEGISVGKDLDNAELHKVWISVNATHIALAADSQQTFYPIQAPEDIHTGFNVTYIGGGMINAFVNNPAKKVIKSQFIGCMQDIIINGEKERVIPDNLNSSNIEAGCKRTDQCRPNPCKSTGNCTDLWQSFTCRCLRPYLGNRCQHEYTAGTFQFESTNNSIASVTISPEISAKFLNAFDISMFVRTRKRNGTIFLLANRVGNNYTVYLEAEIGEVGNLVVHAKWSDGLEDPTSKREMYPVDGLQISDGSPHLISIQREKGLVKISVNGTEHFRKSVGKSRTAFNPTLLYIGGKPALQDVSENQVETRVGRVLMANQTITEVSVDSEADSTISPEMYVTLEEVPEAKTLVVTEKVEVVHSPTGEEQIAVIKPFKGVIQDVRVNFSSNDALPLGISHSHLQQLAKAQNHYVVEFFPLEINSTYSMGEPLGVVVRQNIQSGVVSDNTCIVNQCLNGGTCEITWNDFRCKCANGFDGRLCEFKLPCAIISCPAASTCLNIGWKGFECVSEVSFQGDGALVPHYHLVSNELDNITFNDVSFRFRTKTGGNVLYIANGSQSFGIGLEKEIDSVNQSIDTVAVYISGERHSAKIPNLMDGRWHNASAKLVISEKGAIQLLVDEIEQNLLPPVAVGSVPLDFLNDLIKYSSSEIIVGSNLAPRGRYDVSRIEHNGNVGHPEEAHSDFYRGCLFEVKLGEYRLPFVSPAQLKSINDDNITLVTTTAPTAFYIDEFSMPGKNLHLGCIVCYEGECKNNGHCTRPHDSFACTCARGFEGVFCEQNVDECLDARTNELCLNGGICVDGIANYSCSCPPGFEGHRCDINIDECANVPCAHGGSCVDGVASYTCLCTEEYIGPNCEKRKRSSCRDDPCENGATCFARPSSYPNDVTFRCVCPSGWEDETCGTRINYCKNVNCLNGGKCINRPLGFECLCVPGYDGPHCQVNINECSSSPCLHNGTCKDLINGFDCNCSGTGYRGDRCNLDVNECEMPGICSPAQICKNIPGSYLCLCPDDSWCGERCDIFNPCNNKTCLNNGICKSTCFDERNTEAICECAGNYDGDFCQFLTMAQPDRHIDVLLIIIPVIAALLIAITIGVVILVKMARQKRATRGVYSPSQQEYCNPRVELDNVMKPPPEERLI